MALLGVHGRLYVCVCVRKRDREHEWGGDASERLLLRRQVDGCEYTGVYICVCGGVESRSTYVYVSGTINTAKPRIKFLNMAWRARVCV